MDVKRFQWRVVGAVIAIAIVILIAAYLRDVYRAGNTQQIQYAVGTSGAPNR